VTDREALDAVQREAQQAADELADRYEEIDLLYRLGDILGRSVSLEETANTILKEIAETLTARRGVVMVHDPATASLRAVATLGVDAFAPIPVADSEGVLARVFRERRVALLSPSAPRAAHERVLRDGLLAVPILWTSAGGGGAGGTGGGSGGTIALGIVAVADRSTGELFTAGDRKLMAAIASQVGAALENARLIRASLDQQRLAQEMQLAHDLQMKLLPDAGIVAPQAEAAARVLPATSVGGDFYHLFRLSGERTGVMIGDVSGHGYQAALIMALAMSAAAIHAQRTADPARVLHAMLDSLREELRDTDMYLTLCYAVIDPRKGQIRYANLGHPHAFTIRANGTQERLLAHEPPLGLDMVAKVDATTLPWRRGKDLLVLFTDGISDARDAAGAKLGERKVLDSIVEHRSENVISIVERVVDLVQAHEAGVERRDDLTMVVVRA
jgi:sigma-B regulation protein RsbU (phosphoserine phosphatase)